MLISAADLERRRAGAPAAELGVAADPIASDPQVIRIARGEIHGVKTGQTVLLSIALHATFVDAADWPPAIGNLRAGEPYRSLRVFGECFNAPAYLGVVDELTMGPAGDAVSGADPKTAVTRRQQGEYPGVEETLAGGRIPVSEPDPVEADQS